MGDSFTHTLVDSQPCGVNFALDFMLNGTYPHIWIADGPEALFSHQII